MNMAGHRVKAGKFAYIANQGEQGNEDVKVFVIARLTEETFSGEKHLSYRVTADDGRAGVVDEDKLTPEKEYKTAHPELFAKPDVEDGGETPAPEVVTPAEGA
jgi:hypothetical protein